MLILTAILTMAVAANAGGINGKWKCSKEFLDGLGLHYDQMKGHYKFKKDGTFKVKINGVQRTSAKFTTVGNGFQKAKSYHAQHRTMYIKVRGTYKIVEDSISTIVRPEDVYCYVSPGRNQPNAIDSGDSEIAIRMKESQQRMYDTEVYMTKVQAQTVKDELMHVWTWSKEPITVNKEALSIGDKATFMRE